MQCIELKVISKNHLKFTFVNVILNCCPEEIVADAVIHDNILKINFIETPLEGMCY